MKWFLIVYLLITILNTKGEEFKDDEDKGNFINTVNFYKANFTYFTGYN